MLKSWEEKDDSTLLRNIADGSHPAFAVLVQRHSSRFYAVAYRFMANRQEAEDIVQEAFLKLWERPDIWQDGRNSKFTTWFYRVVTNLCLDKIKRKAPLPILDGVDFADGRISQLEELELSEQQKELENQIRQLPERQQTALNLCFYEGLSNLEAAEIMNINLKALQSLLMRAKATLKEKMQIQNSGNYEQLRKHG